MLKQAESPLLLEEGWLRHQIVRQAQTGWSVISLHVAGSLPESIPAQIPRFRVERDFQFAGFEDFVSLDTGFARTRSRPGASRSVACRPTQRLVHILDRRNRRYKGQCCIAGGTSCREVDAFEGTSTERLRRRCLYFEALSVFPSSSGCCKCGGDDRPYDAARCKRDAGLTTPSAPVLTFDGAATPPLGGGDYQLCSRALLTS
jgi:hypothetical protein